jgi:hypothetical protein
MLRLALFSNENWIDSNFTDVSNPAHSIFINNNGGASCFAAYVANNSSNCNIGWNLGNSFQRDFDAELTTIFCDESYTFLPCLVFTWGSASEKQDLDNWLLNASFNIKICPKYAINSSTYYDEAFNIPFVGSNVQLRHNGVVPYYFLLPGNVYCYNPDYLSIVQGRSRYPCNNSFSNFAVAREVRSISFVPFDDMPYQSIEPPVECLDSRTSSNTQTLHFVISDTESNVSNLDINFDLSDGSNQEFAIKTYMNDTLYNSLINLYNLNHSVTARCMFTGGVIRSACDVRLVAKVYGESLSVEPSLTPPYVGLDFDVNMGIDVDVLRCHFEPCSDKPTRIQEDIVSYINGLQTNNTFSVGFGLYQVIPYKVVITGCEALTDYCCDEAEPSDNDLISYGSYIEPILRGYGGQGGASGGDSVDISCICDALDTLNSNLVSKLEAIKDSIEDINIDVSSGDIVTAINGISNSVDGVSDTLEDYLPSNTCICDNLAALNNNVSALHGNNSELADIASKLNQLQNISSNINNTTVELGNIESDLKCNQESLACIVKNKRLDGNYDSVSVDTTPLNNVLEFALNCDKNEGIACILKNKNLSVNTDSIDIDLSGIEDKLEDIKDTLSDTNDTLSDTNDTLSDALNVTKIEGGEEVTNSITEVIDSKNTDVNVETIVEPSDTTYIRRASLGDVELG